MTITIDLLLMTAALGTAAAIGLLALWFYFNYLAARAANLAYLLYVISLSSSSRGEKTSSKLGNKRR